MSLKKAHKFLLLSHFVWKSFRVFVVFGIQHNKVYFAIVNPIVMLHILLLFPNKSKVKYNKISIFRSLKAKNLFLTGFIVGSDYNLS